MPLFDACIHSFGSAGTGGFSSRNLSMGAYNNAYFEIVIGIFMLLFGINFNLYYFLLVRRFRDVFRSEELWAYVLIVATAVAAITLDIVHMYESVGTSLRHAFFQVSSIITTTGYATVDFNTWPTFSKAILVALMFIGGCAGSTAGGIKVARVVILQKVSVSEMRRMLHPNAVPAIQFEGKPLNERSIRGVHLFLAVYLMVFVASCLLVSLEQLDLVTTFTAVAACINNVGPGLEIVGPMGNFSSFSPWSKLLLSFDMLVGRLEIFPHAASVRPFHLETAAAVPQAGGLTCLKIKSTEQDRRGDLRQSCRPVKRRRRGGRFFLRWGKLPGSAGQRPPATASPKLPAPNRGICFPGAPPHRQADRRACGTL